MNFEDERLALALKKMMRYCAYQDRCHQEVRYKGIQLKIYGQDLEEIMSELIKQDFLNEERFAKSYARGKFRIKKWGKNRIKHEFRLRNISEYCVKKAMKEIDDAEYELVLKQLLSKEFLRHEDSHPAVAKDKAIQKTIKKGFETELVYKLAKEVCQ